MYYNVTQSYTWSHQTQDKLFRESKTIGKKEITPKQSVLL